MKKLVAILVFTVSLYATAQVPGTRPIIKSAIYLPQATAPANPMVGEKYLSTDGQYYRFTGAEWVVDVIGGADQTITLANNVLTLSNGGSVDLTPYLDNTDSQTITDFSLSGTILTLTISDGNTVTVDLSGIVGNGSLQDLSLNENQLNITGGDGVNLSPITSINRAEQKWVIFGDSFSSLSTDDYPYYVVQNLGMDLDNVETHAISGGALTSTLGALDALPTGYFDDKDLVTLHIGTNDYYGNRIVGDMSMAADNSTAVFIQNLKYFVETVQAAKPSVEIVLITPAKTWQAGNTYLDRNNKGYFIKDYAQAMKDVASAYGLSVIDVYSKYPINSQNYTLYSTDLIHPNEVGKLVLADVVSSALKSKGHQYETSNQELDYSNISYGGVNLFNKETVTDDLYMSATGYTVASEVYCLSDFIPVIEGETYTTNHDIRFSTFFNGKRDGVISGGRSGNSSDPFVIPEGVKWIRITLLKTYKEYFQLEKGSFSTGFKKYNPPIHLFYDNTDSNLKENTVKKAIDELANFDHATLFQIGKNKFNKDTAERGRYMSDNGFEAANTAYDLSDFIKVKEGVEYQPSHNIRYSTFFEEDKTTIISGGRSSLSDDSFIIPANVSYIRISIPTEDYDNFQLEEGNIKTNYEVYDEGLKIPFRSKSGLSSTNVQDAIDEIAASSTATTGSQYYPTTVTSKKTLTDADFSAAANYKSQLFNVTSDTLELGDGVTATNYNKALMVIPSSVSDNAYIKPVDGDTFRILNTNTAFTADGIVLTGNEVATIFKVDANTWIVSASAYTEHNEVADAVGAFDWQYDFNAESTSLGTLTSWSNDGSGVVTSATQGTAGSQPTVIDESGRKAVQFDGVDDKLSMGTPSDLDFNIGTDTGTIIVVIGDDTGTTGSIVGDRATDRNINIGRLSATNMLTQIGDGGQINANYTGTDSGAFIWEVSFDDSTVSTYLNGVLQDDAVSQVTGEISLQEWFIGARASDTFFNGSIRRILIKRNAQLTSGERAAHITQLTNENL
ncbi:SGNH/GDSL hydrolase family protein [Croceivirga sp. JEA036]|uniref:SGNH/GDSL hydrolase family protein n=1 Tax=Croceivirga sp. JEA036 TaxID=2721162 RepID=UPI0014391A68|nr:SGNH/GDSL hydrolase family protein [Croceivirga sp. JEA036]NJB36395.1 SGNH/GDSL hydrolase family protein [Croceivirga sp. JEA036]